MSWQAVELIRDHSRARGATRLIGLVLASYACRDKDGSGSVYGNVHPSIETIRRGTGAVKGEDGKLKGGATRKTVIDARRWFVQNGEAEIVRSKMSRTGSTIPVLDFSPLLARAERSSADELDLRAPARAISDSPSEAVLLSSVSGSPSEPLVSSERTLEGSPERTLRGAPANPSETKGSPSEPLAGKGFGGEPSGSGLSVSSAGPVTTEAQRAAERREDEAELAALEGQLATTKRPESTRRCIAELKERLGQAEAVA